MKKIKINLSCWNTPGRYMLNTNHKTKKGIFYKRYLWIFWIKWFAFDMNENKVLLDAISFLQFLNNK